MSFKQTITHNLLNIPGWNTKRRIVVFECDDWGAIRMPSKAVFEYLVSKGFNLQNNPYEKNDSLATEDDLCALFEVLRKYRDCKGNNPMFTANCVVANPDFERIEKDKFEQYYNESITATMKRYKGCEHSFDLWIQGLTEGLFFPQCHGREHLNVARWMHILRSGDEDNLIAFFSGMMGIPPKFNPKKGNVFQVALDDSLYKAEPIENILIDALNRFEKLFGYRSKTFIAPCYTWRSSLEKTLYDNGVLGIQGIVYQRDPNKGLIRHWQGTRNEFGQIYTIRNCSFEPTLQPDIDSISDCLYRIKCAFRWHKPAVISTHRINYIGAIREENRINNLKQLDTLLSLIVRNWPDVEFLNSEQLVNEIR